MTKPELLDKIEAAYRLALGSERTIENSLHFRGQMVELMDDLFLFLDPKYDITYLQEKKAWRTK